MNGKFFELYQVIHMYNIVFILHIKLWRNFDKISDLFITMYSLPNYISKDYFSIWGELEFYIKINVDK